MMKALLELVKLNVGDVITASGAPCGDYEPEINVCPDDNGEF